MEKFTAIVLAGGTGKRMHSHIHKQYLTLAGKPVLYYALKAFEESDITDIILVTGADEEAYCKRKIIDKYHIGKVKAIVPGGVERYHSVYAGLCAAEGADYVLIHDGARPLVSADIIKRSMQAVKEYRACVAGMPVKDTIKIADEDGYAKLTPERSKVCLKQTPQSASPRRFAVFCPRPNAVNAVLTAVHNTPAPSPREAPKSTAVPRAARKA